MDKDKKIKELEEECIKNDGYLHIRVENLNNRGLPKLINQICKLKPKNQVTKEKITTILGKYGVICGLQEKYKKQLSIINCDTLYEFYGIVANEILREE